MAPGVYVELGVKGEFKVETGWINVIGGVRAGAYLKATFCLACAGHTCDVTEKVSGSIKGRLWASLELDTWWSKNKWEIVREYSGE